MRKTAACLLVLVAAACSRSDLALETVAAAPDHDAAMTGDDAQPQPMLPCPALDASAPGARSCRSWRIASSDTLVSGPPAPGGAVYLTALVPSGNGALISWFTAADPGTASWNTRALNLDGTPRSPIVPHLSFSTMGGVYTDVMSLAVTPSCAFGGLVDDEASGCRFIPLDGNGNETGPAVSLRGGMAGGCSYLGPAPDGFSYIQQSPANGGPTEVVAIGTDGSFQGHFSLGVLPGFGTRLVLSDETFLLASFFENEDAGGNLTEQVTPYDAHGTPLAPTSTVTTGSGSILLMAESARGVMTSWLGFDPSTKSGQAMYTAPIARNGTPEGAPQALDVTGAVGPIYGFSLDASPSGDSILTWNNLDEATNRYQFFMTSLDDVGRPRGAPIALGTYEGVGDVHVLVGADGENALVVYSGAPVGGSGGVHALPLLCASH